MRKVMAIIGFAIFALVGFLAVAQTAVTPLPVCTDGMDFFACLGLSIGSFKGASVLAIVAISVQLLIKLMNADFAANWFSGIPGWLKLTIVSGLTIVGSVVGLMYTNGMSFWAAVTSGGILTSLMVFANQIYQHFFPAATPTPTSRR